MNQTTDRIDVTSMAGRHVVITGASRNIGAATARRFAAAGAHLLLAARGHDQLEATADGLRRGYPVRIETVSADVGSEAGVDAIVAAAGRYLEGRCDVLVNNAMATADTFGRDILDIEWQAWDRCIRVNLQAAWMLSRAFAPGMRSEGRGSIVNVLSTAGFTPVDGFAPYGATKAALWMLTKYLAKELAPAVRANAVCPGTTAEHDQPSARRAAWDQVIPKVPLQRIGGPEETAHAVFFLGSDLSSYTTGQVLFVDGGRVSVG